MSLAESPDGPPTAADTSGVDADGSPPDTMTGARAVVRILQEWRYSTFFGYPGTSELELCGAVTEPAGLTLTNSRGDKEAVFMAAGANLVGETAYAAILHAARGLTNALGAIADVRRSEISVLCLVGLPSTSSAPYLPPHAEVDLMSRAGAFASATFESAAFPVVRKLH
jgi:acetolactate synthase I/II/III large subunit